MNACERSDWDDKAMEENAMVGASPLMRQARFLLDKVAPTDVPVLITGPSGSGKEVVAHAIQRRSLRRGKPFVIKNCASLQKDMARSELFGHVRGAFTGAAFDHPGLFGEADGGTLFLDEIGDLPPDVQPSLLRALENGTFRPVGSGETRSCDIRLIFATNRDLAAAVDAGSFNEALYHRIHVFNIALPPLSARPEDIPALADYFLRTLPVAVGRRPALSDAVMGCLTHYAWPGNVRELRNVLERAVILAENGVITASCLPPEIACPLCASEPPSGNGAPRDPAWETSCPGHAEPGPPPSSSPDSLAFVVRNHITRILEDCGHNQTLAADRLGINRRTLYRKLKDWGIE